MTVNNVSSPFRFPYRLFIASLFTQAKEKASGVTPYPVKSSILRWRPVLSRFYPRVQYEKIEGFEQSTFPYRFNILC